MINTKISEEKSPEPSFQNKENVSTNQEKDTVCIYLRNTNKISLKLYTNPNISISNLLKLARTHANLPEESILIYFQGKKYDEDDKNSTVILRLREKSIIHLKNREKIAKGKMEIALEIYNSSKIKLASRKHEVFGTQKIQSFIWEVSAVYNEFTKITPSLIECGRKLSPQKTFYQEQIQDKTTLIIVLEEKIHRLTQKPKKEKKLSESINFNNPFFKKSCSLIPSFKKKQKGSMMYRSSSKNFQAQFMWESDSSSEMTQHQLMTSLWKKKQKQNFQDHLSFMRKSSEKTDCEKGQFHQFSQFQWEFKKLLQSQNLNYKEEDLKELQPPEIMTNDCFEESEDLDSLQEDQEQGEDQSSNYYNSSLLGLKKKNQEQIERNFFEENQNAIMEI